MSKKLLAITPGDVDGIGPEVTTKALRYIAKRSPKFFSQHEIHIFSERRWFPNSLKVVFHEPPFSNRFSGWAIIQAAQLVSQHPRAALVTGPISKLNLHREGLPYQGHTDLLGSLFRVSEPTMLLENETFRVALATDHVPLSLVANNLNIKSVVRKIGDLIQYLYLLNIKAPKIAVLGLNPHAGEFGILGKEEQKILVPALQRAKKVFPGVAITGPVSADAFFALELKKKPAARHHAILAMYHDQGLIPLKMCGFNSGINVTLGLPIIRTSVDHGTGNDIFGKNIANPASMIRAINAAARMI